MNSINPNQKNHKNHKNLRKSSSQGESKKAFTITHIDKNSPETISIDLIAARNEAAANTVAKRHFPNSTILRIAANTKKTVVADYPDARFIKGEFRLVDRPDDRLDSRSWGEQTK